MRKNSILFKALVGCFVVLAPMAFAADAKKKTEKGKKEMLVTMNTTEGKIEIKLFPETAPKTVDNFIGLATGKSHLTGKDWEWTDPKTQAKMTGKALYPGTIFHRIIPGFMIQGGDPLGKGFGGPGYRFADETSPKDNFDKPGILAMANAGPNTNGSQFFITVKPTPWLNGRHTIFGEVVSGMDIVEKIVNAPRGAQDFPNNPVKINSIELKK